MLFACLQKGPLGELISCELCHLLALVEDDYAVADCGELFMVAGEDEDCRSMRRKDRSLLEQFFAGARIDALRRLIKEEHLWGELQPLPKDDLLLITATEHAHLTVWFKRAQTGALKHVKRCCTLGLPIKWLEPSTPTLQTREGDILRGGRIHPETITLPIGWHGAHALCNRRPRISERK